MTCSHFDYRHFDYRHGRAKEIGTFPQFTVLHGQINGLARPNQRAAGSTAAGAVVTWGN